MASKPDPPADDDDSSRFSDNAPMPETPTIDSPGNISKWKKLIYGDEYNSAASFLESPVPISAPPLYGNQGHQPTSNQEKWRRLIYGDDYVDDMLTVDRQTPVKKKTHNKREQQKWERMIYGDNYFDSNIAAITSDWEDEDSSFGGSAFSSAKFQNLKRLVSHHATAVIAVGLVCTITAFLFIGGHMGGVKSSRESRNAFVTKSVTPESDLVAPQHHYVGVGNVPDDNDYTDDQNRRDLLVIDEEDQISHIASDYLRGIGQHDLI